MCKIRHKMSPSWNYNSIVGQGICFSHLSYLNFSWLFYYLYTLIKFLSMWIVNVWCCLACFILLVVWLVHASLFLISILYQIFIIYTCLYYLFFFCLLVHTVSIWWWVGNHEELVVASVLWTSSRVFHMYDV